jgi:hypothetical protein
MCELFPIIITIFKLFQHSKAKPENVHKILEHPSTKLASKDIFKCYQPEEKKKNPNTRFNCPPPLPLVTPSCYSGIF